MSVKVFISYSHKDAEFRRKLDVHLAGLRRDGAIETFFDGDINPGDNLDITIKRELRTARIFVALASPEYINSTYCFEKEYQYAIRRARKKTMNVVVAVLRPCGWKHTRMASYKSLPEDGKEVTTWGNRDSAFEDIVNGIRRVVKLVESTASEAPSAPSPRRTKAKAVTRVPKVTPLRPTTENAATKPVRSKVVRKRSAARPTGSKRTTASSPSKATRKPKVPTR